MNEVLNTLGQTVDSITDKINTSKESATRYKNNIINQLEALLAKIEQLKRDAATNPLVTQLRQQLQATQENLAAKTEELAASNSTLAELNSRISDLTAQLRSKQNEIDATDRELAELAAERERDRAQNVTDTNAFSELRGDAQNQQTNNDAAFEQLNLELQTLRTEKVALEQRLAASQQALEDFIGRISEINARLVGEIQKINTILDELGDGADVSEKISAIGTNLESIINVINNPVGGRRKTKKMRGGYLYSKKPNSNSSSISRSKSKSNSNSNSNSKSKSRRKKRLLNF